MSNIQDTSAPFRPIQDEDSKTEPVVSNQPVRPTNLKWVMFALIATVCFSASGFIIGIIAANGASAKFLNSIGYFVISLIIIIVKNVNYCRRRSSIEKTDPQRASEMPKIATMKQSAFFDQEEEEYKWKGIFISLFCGILNFGGEFCVVFAFSHALDSLMNQGILSSIYALGAVIVLIGSVAFIGEHVKSCECKHRHSLID